MTLSGIKYAHQIHTEIDIAVCELEHLTGMTPDEQRARMVEAALDWVELMTNNDPVAIKHIPATPEFWGFWKTVWLYANKQFISWAQYALLAEIIERHELAFYFDAMHRSSFDNDIINTPATEAGYHVVIKQLAVKR